MWMDARELSFEDDRFDVVFTLSSIEHFGAAPDVARAARELGRVVRPGGVAVIATDYLVRQHRLDTWPVELAIRVGTLGRKMQAAGVKRRVSLSEAFTWSELDELIVRPSGLRPIQELDTTLSPESWRNPMLVRPVKRSALTSAVLVLEKPPR
jgi:SAM-dependent methyltransferase